MALWYQGENNVGECCDPQYDTGCSNLHPHQIEQAQKTPSFLTKEEYLKNKVLFDMVIFFLFQSCIIALL